MLGVLDLRMELEAEEGTVEASHRLHLAVRRTREDHEPIREDGDLVVVGLPDLERGRKAHEEDVRLMDREDRLPEFRDLRGSRVAPEVFRHELVARADAQDGTVQAVEVLPVLAHLLGVEAYPRRPPGEDEAVNVLQVGGRRVVRDDLRLGAEVLQDPPFTVGPLAAIVDDVDAHRLSKWAGPIKVLMGRYRPFLGFITDRVPVHCEEGWRVHATPRRTILGVDCLFWALVLDLALVLATFVASVAVIPGFFMALGAGQDPASLTPHLPCMVVYLSLSILFGLSTIILFFAGFLDLYAGRREFGRTQERHLFRARAFLAVTIALSIAFALLPRQPGMAVGVPEEILASSDWAAAARVVLAALIALFMGLTLANSVYGLMDQMQRSRIRIAVGLGVVAALTGSVFGVIGITSGNLHLIIVSIVAGAIAGDGVAAISLILFLYVFREIRRGLRRGWALAPPGP